MKFYPILFSILILSACGSSPTSGGGDSGDAANTTTGKEKRQADPEPLYCQDLTELKDLEDTTLFNKTHILSYELIEGCACIKYEYSGCRRGERILAWNGEWSESNRPEVMMRLLVKNAGLCEQLFTDSTCFSLKEMQLVGNEVLVYLNNENNNLLLDYNDRVTD